LSEAQACSHCRLPLGRLAQRREIDGTEHAFCCYGCCLAYQVHHGAREEPQAALWLIRLGVGGFLAMQVMLFSLLRYADTGAEDAWVRGVVPWLLWGLTTPLLLVVGGPFLAGAWASAREARMTADTLVSLGALAAYSYSAWQVIQGGGQLYFDTVTMVLVLFTLGRYLEAQGRVRAVRSLAPMLSAERAEVRVLSGAGEAVRPVREIRPGDVLSVVPGERIAVDAEVVEGCSECDESVLTGQAEPRPKAPGDRVYAGSLNGSGRLVLRALVPGDRTRWVRIGRLVREALAGKSLMGEALDRVAAYFVPLVLALAGTTVWFWASRGGFDQALLAGLAVLVVACPCALGLAAPLATSVGIAEAARRGILIRGAGALERLGSVKGIAFDKTGTLTQWKLQPVAVGLRGADEAAVLGIARGLAAGSDHPVARAVIAQAAAARITERPAERARAHPGAGITGQIGGTACGIGSLDFMTRLGWSVPEAWLPRAAEEDCTLLYVGWGGRVYGRLGFAEHETAEARRVVAALRRQGLEPLLLSGDRRRPVARLARSMGIATWQAEASPEAKARIVGAWGRRRGPIAMVGDGLNDGPVLAAASVGIAVGGGTDLAKESADVVLPDEGLTALPWLLRLARAVRRSVRINLAWAFAYNAVALALAAGGLLRPVLAAALMAGSSLVIVSRSLRRPVPAGIDFEQPEGGVSVGAAPSSRPRRAGA